MSHGGSAGGGKSSMGYLFGDSEPPKPAAAPAAKVPPVEKPASIAADVAKQIPAGIQGSQANNYFRADGQNTGNFITAVSPGKMSLISQNVLQKRRLEKSEADVDNDEGIGSPIVEDAEVGKEAKLDNNNKERKKQKVKVLEAKQNQEEEEMRQLESSLFGAIYAPLEFGTEVGAAAAAPEQHAPLYFMDRSAGDGKDDLPFYEEDLSREDKEDEVGSRGRKPAWVDEEEERTEVDILKVARLKKLRKEVDEHVISGKEYEARLRGQHAKLNPFTGRADMDRKAPLSEVSDDESDEEGRVDDILQNNNELVVKDTAKLLPGMFSQGLLMLMLRNHLVVLSIQCGFIGMGS